MDIYVGADISKGYADFAISDGEGQIRKELQLDDTRRGHDRAIRLMRELNKRAGKEEELVVGMEATGGMEANWLQLFEDLSEELDLTVYRLNALVLRKFAEQQLHGGKTDRISARRIAAFLRRGSIEEHHPLSETGAEPGLRTLSRKTMGMIEESVELKNELHALLQRAHPEMVQHVRGDLSQWVLRLLKNYPTPDQLFEAGPEELAEIPYVTEEKAQGLVENARTSVASQTDEETGLALSLTAEDLLRLERRIDRLKERLWNRIKDQRAPRLLESIEGIGKWGATVLYLEIGDITRFDSVAQLVAFAGGFCWTRPAVGRKWRPDRAEEHQQAGKPAHSIDSLQLCHLCAHERRQPPGPKPLRTATGKRKAQEGRRNRLHALGSWRSYTAAGPTASASIQATKNGSRPGRKKNPRIRTAKRKTLPARTIRPHRSPGARQNEEGRPPRHRRAIAPRIAVKGPSHNAL